MIDFSNAKEELNCYKGSEKKKTLIFNGKKHLVKFPDPIKEKNREVYFINNAFSEYVGSKIFELCDFEVQETLLGRYNYNGKEKIVCGCCDFTSNDIKLFEFENLALSAYPDRKIDTELSDVLLVIGEIENMTGINILLNDNISDRFFDMFIIDALIGNSDRHNGNWGIIVDNAKHIAKFSPIYDCGSCLNPIYSDDDLENIDDNELKNLAINNYSCLKIDGKKINYMSLIKDLNNDECNKAVVRVFNKIDMNKINTFIDNIESMSDIRKKFYKDILSIRYNIIKETYEKLI